MKNKYFYPIFKLKAKSWIRYWLLKKTEFKEKLSEILEGSSFTLNNTLSMKFNLFEIYGNSIQDGEPSPENEVPILNAGDNGSITEKIVNSNILDTSEVKTVKNQTGANRAGYYCKIPKTGRYLLLLNTTNTMYFGKSNNLEQATTLVGSTNSSFSTNYDFNAGEYFVIWGTKTDTDKLMVKLADGQTDYIPHEEQTYTIPVLRPMLSLGDVRDCFVKKSDGWYERHYIGRHIFTGTETMINEASLSDVNRYIFSISGVKTSNALSNYYKYLANYTSNTEHFYVWTNQIIVFHSNTITSGANYKTWLSEKYANRAPVYVDYLLATPLDLPCTPEQTNILENIPSTYAGQTNIYSPDEVKPFLKIQYWESDTNG